MIPKTPKTCPNTSLHVLIVIPKLISTGKETHAYSFFALILEVHHLKMAGKKNNIQLFSSEM